MASRKKAIPTPVAPAIVLTPPTKAKSKKAEKLEMKGFEKDVARLRALQREIESNTADFKAGRKKLVRAAKDFRLQAEQSGSFHKTLILPSEDNNPALMCFQDKYSEINVIHEDVLREGLGEHYDFLIQKGVNINVKSGTTLQELKSALGEEAFTKLKNFIEVTEYLKPVPDFMERKASLSQQLSVQTKQVLEAIIDQVQYDPSFKLNTAYRS